MRGVLSFCLIMALAAGIDAATAAEEPVELDKITVEGIQQGLVMRAIQVALNTPRSSKREDLDKMVCWFDQRTGSHQTYLYCSTNRALEKTSSYLQGAGSPVGIDEIVMYRVNRGELEKNLAALGPVEVNQEIVQRTMAGEKLPDNLPDQAELDSFVEAFAQVRAVSESYDPRINAASGEKRDALIRESDARMIAAIRDAGLTVERYNEISELVSRYANLKEYVRNNVGG